MFWGCGLSDRDVTDLSLDTWVGDLESVVEAAGVERFPLFAHSQGAAIGIGVPDQRNLRCAHDEVPVRRGERGVNGHVKPAELAEHLRTAAAATPRT